MMPTVPRSPGSTEDYYGLRRSGWLYRNCWVLSALQDETLHETDLHTSKKLLSHRANLRALFLAPVLSALSPSPVCRYSPNPEASTESNCTALQVSLKLKYRGQSIMFNGKDDILWNAVSSRDLTEVKRAVAAGGDVNMTCRDNFVRKEAAANSGGNTGKSLLHHAAWIGSLPIFKFLVECGADINRRRYTVWRPHGGVNGRGPTPFHFAVQYNRIDIVKYLIELGVDINSAGEQGDTALHISTKFNYPEIVRLLLECGARTDMVSKGETARDSANGKQERSHAEMGDMKDAEFRSRPLPQWLPSGRRKADPIDNREYSQRQLPPMERSEDESHKGQNSFQHHDYDCKRQSSQGVYGVDVIDMRVDQAGQNHRNKYDYSSYNEIGTVVKGSKSAHHSNIANGTQNNGNIIGDKSTVRQSKLFRMYESGNEVKSILGQDCLRWDVNKKQGAYEGRVFDSGKTSGHGYYSEPTSNRTIPELSRIQSVSIHSNKNTARNKRAQRQVNENEYSRWTTTSRQSYA